MSVTQTLMGPGSFSVSWRDRLPQSIRNKVEPWDHVVIGPKGLTDLGLDDAGLLAAVKTAGGYTGVILTIDNDGITGQDASWWLGDPGGFGPVVEDKIVKPTPATTTAWVNEFLPVNAISTGTVTNGTSFSGVSSPQSTVIELLNWVCEESNTEWRLRPDFTIDIGPSTTLFPAPTASSATIITDSPSGDEGGLSGVDAVDLDRLRDGTGVVGEAIIMHSSDHDEIKFATVSTTPTGVRWKDPAGNTPSRAMRVISPEMRRNRAVRFATNVLSRVSVDQKEAFLTSNTHNVTAEVTPGQRVWVYDLESGLFDTANQVTWRGEPISPIQMRVHALSWPIDDTRGVYLRLDGGAEWVDVTSYVAVESGPVSWEVTISGRRRNRSPVQTSITSVSMVGDRKSSTGNTAYRAASQPPPILRAAPSSGDGVPMVQLVGDGGTLVRRVVTDAVTANASTTLTSATASFTDADIGRLVVGEGIPDGTVVSSRSSATTVTMSAAATATLTDATIAIGPNATHARALLDLTAASLSGKWDAGERRSIMNVRDLNGSPILSVFNVGGLWVTDDIRFLDGSFSNLASFKFRRAVDRSYPGVVFGEDGGLTTRTVTDGVTTSGSSTVTSASASFTDADRGRCLIGSGIPDNAIITSVGSATSVTISAPASATATGVSLTITTTDVGTATAIYRGTVAGTPSLYMRTGNIDAFRVASGDVFMLGGTIKQAAAPSSTTDVVRVTDMLPMTVALENSGQALTTSMAVVVGSNAVIGQSFFTIPSGLKLQVRLVGVFTGHTSGDTLELQFVDAATTSTVATGSLATSTSLASQIATSWVDVPATAWRGYAEVRNATAARGNSRAMRLEYRFANA